MHVESCSMIILNNTVCLGSETMKVCWLKKGMSDVKPLLYVRFVAQAEISLLHAVAMVRTTAHCKAMS